MDAEEAHGPVECAVLLAHILVAPVFVIQPAPLDSPVGCQAKRPQAEEREAEEDEWYVDALAVFTNWGRKGIATRLMQAAEQQARHHHYPKIALNVAQENEQALSLYQRLQYVVTRETFLYNHPHVRLVKQLENG